MVCSCVVLCMTCCRFPRWTFKFTQRSRISSTNCSFTTTVFRETVVFWLYICAGLHFVYSVTMVMCIYTAWVRKLFLFSISRLIGEYIERSKLCEGTSNGSLNFAPSCLSRTKVVVKVVFLTTSTVTVSLFYPES